MVIVLSLTFMFLLIFLIMIGSIFTKYWDFFEVLIVIDGIMLFISSFSLMILLPIFGLVLKPQKAEKIDLRYDDFQSFLEDITIKTAKRKFLRYEVNTTNKQYRFEVFTRKKLWMLESIYVVGVDELTNDSLNTIYEKFDEFLMEFYGKSVITDWVSVIIIICVENDSPSFHKFVNSNINQTFKFFQLPVGVSFKTRKLLIARQKDGYAVGKYKKLRKQFLEIIRDERI